MMDGKPSYYVLGNKRKFSIPDKPTKLRFDVMVREHLPKPFNVISALVLRKFIKWYHIHIQSRIDWQSQTLLAKRFTSASQVERLCATFHKDIVDEILPSFLMRICAEDSEGADMLDKNKDLLREKWKSILQRTPTDSYLLDLSIQWTTLCMSLLRINNDINRLKKNSLTVVSMVTKLL